MQKSILGIIPARGGSKGVLRKNIRLINGRPLISYAIASAQQSMRLTDFVVSTEDTEIAEVAQSYGCDVVLRPEHLAQDKTPMIPVIQHVIEERQRQQQTVYDAIVLLQPTTPLREGQDIDTAIDLLERTDADSIVSVYQVTDQHPARMYRLIDGYLTPYDKEPAGRLRQALPAVYHRNGVIYACYTDLVVKQGTLIGAKTEPYLMPKERSLNIDDEFDLLIADLVISNNSSLT